MTDNQIEAATGAEILKEIVDGLHDVSDGPWECDFTDSENDEGTFNSQLLWDKDGGVIADAINANATRIITEYSGDGDEYVDVIDVLALNNFRHFARCSPDNIRAIAAYVDTLETNLAACIKASGEYADDLVRVAADKDTALQRAAALEKQVHVPGKLACPKCKFELISMSLNAHSGTVTADNKSDVCPNGCGPLWKVSERDERVLWNDLADKQFQELKSIEAERDAARARAQEVENTLEGLLGEIDNLIGDSGGVYGLHLNGNAAPWEELDDWLPSRKQARAVLKEGEQMAMELKPLPCPACGSCDLIYRVLPHKNSEFYAVCCNVPLCSVTGPSRQGVTQATEAWNSLLRAPDE